MFRNPIYKKEVKSSSRSPRTLIVILVFNSILAVVGLSLLKHIINNIRFNGTTEYSAMLQLYILTSSLEFMLLILIIPGQAAEAISGERERKTMDIILTTNIKPFAIVLGKLEASLSTVFLLIISSFPVLSLVFIYGGIQFTDLLLLLTVLLLNAAYIGSAGICASAYFKRISASTIVSYLFLIVVIGGTLFVTQLPYLTNNTLSSYTVSQVNLPWYTYLLLFNPGVTFYYMINLQAGNPNALLALINPIGIYRPNFIIDYWLYISLLVQFAATLFLFFSAVHQVRVHPRFSRYISPRGK